VDRCALFVDAGYVLADGAMAVHGTRHRDSVTWDYSGLLKFLSGLSRDRSGLPVLRCYWYEAAAESARTSEHDTLADLPGLKLRLGRMRPGRRDGVETEMHRDLTTLARNGAISDAVVVSGEEDLAEVIAEVQDLGLRVILVHITVDGTWTISRLLRQECDDILEIGGAHLRPFVDLIAGAEPARRDEEYQAGPYTGRSLANGHGLAAGAVTHHGLPAAALPAPPAIYTAPVVTEYQRGAQSLPAARQAPQEEQVPARSQPGGPPGQQGGRQAQPGGMPQAQPGGRQQGQAGDAAGQAGDAAGQPAGLPRADSSQGAFGAGGPLGAPAGSAPGPQPSQHGDDQVPRLQGAQAYPPPDQFLGRMAVPGADGPAGPDSGQPGGSQRHAMGGAAQQYPPAGTGPYGGPGDPLPRSQFSGPQHGQHSGGALGPAFGAPQGAPYSGPQPAASQAPVPQPVAVSLADAVQAAHAEGFGFGEAVARDAPALWLEAVLARKPRMPSDLEARLLQGSALPIDSLLHDEVRHALRRGFWDALERSRR
jgi:NYN domain